MKETFDHDGHLTHHALRQLIDGEPEELTRLEIAEHLSFCDRCTEHYTDLLCACPLLEPPEPLGHCVLRQLAQRGRALFFHRYVAAGMAACLTLVFWFTGVFEQRFDPQDEYYPAFYHISEQAVNKTQQLGETLTEGLSNFFNQLSNLEMKGVFQDEKK